MSRTRNQQTYRDRYQRGDMASQFAVWLAELHGHHAVVLPKRQCPPELPNLRFYFKDDGDILIDNRMVQTKWVSIEWTGRQDFPYPMMIVDEWHKAQNSIRQGAVAYWIFNRDLTSLAVFPMSLSRHLVYDKRFNKDVDQRRLIEYAMCPLDLVEWRPIPHETTQAAVEWGIIPKLYNRLSPRDSGITPM